MEADRPIGLPLDVWIFYSSIIASRCVFPRERLLAIARALCSGVAVSGDYLILRCRRNVSSWASRLFCVENHEKFYHRCRVKRALHRRCGLLFLVIAYLSPWVSLVVLSDRPHHAGSCVALELPNWSLTLSHGLEGVIVDPECCRAADGIHGLQSLEGGL